MASENKNQYGLNNGVVASHLNGRIAAHPLQAVKTQPDQQVMQNSALGKDALILATNPTGKKPPGEETM